MCALAHLCGRLHVGVSMGVDTYACMCHACMYACVHACLYVACVHVCLCASCVHACSCRVLHACMLVLFHACMHACVVSCVHACLFVSCIDMGSQAHGETKGARTGNCGMAVPLCVRKPPFTSALPPVVVPLGGCAMCPLEHVPPCVREPFYTSELPQPAIPLTRLWLWDAPLQSLQLISFGCVPPSLRAGVSIIVFGSLCAQACVKHCVYRHPLF